MSLRNVVLLLRVLFLPMATTFLSHRGGLRPLPCCSSRRVVMQDGLQTPAEQAEAAELMAQFQELQAQQAAQGLLRGKCAAEGSVAVGTASSAHWREGGAELSLWIPVSSGLRARDVRVVFLARSLTVEAAGAALLSAAPLRGRVEPDECWWAFDDDDGMELEEGSKVLHVVLAKADNAVWAGVFDEE
mmetsp:Transcript_25290/g.51376  ORF Transcript_25290/g.51376 Transcript_25290/m.51376 type:complete len:188 (+) Transcript_25290:34-597(+)